MLARKGRRSPPLKTFDKSEGAMLPSPDAYHMVGTRVRLSFKNSENPYENTSGGKTR